MERSNVRTMHPTNRLSTLYKPHNEHITQMPVVEKRKNIMIDAKIDQEIYTLLDDLMTKNKDAEAGYRKAADSLSDLEMKAVFIRYAQRRANFVKELKQEILDLGGGYTTGTSFASSAHRVWMDMVSTFTGKDSTFIYEECLRGEKASLQEYEDATSNNLLPDSTKELIERHQGYIKGIINNLESKVASLETSNS